MYVFISYPAWLWLKRGWVAHASCSPRGPGWEDSGPISLRWQLRWVLKVHLDDSSSPRVGITGMHAFLSSWCERLLADSGWSFNLLELFLSQWCHFIKHKGKCSRSEWSMPAVLIVGPGREESGPILLCLWFWWMLKDVLGENLAYNSTQVICYFE